MSRPHETEAAETGGASRSSEQRRAADALRAVRRVEERASKLEASHGIKLRKSYRSYAERIGPSILTNGLGQTLASEWAAGGEAVEAPKPPDQAAHYYLFHHLASWLCRPGGVYRSTSQGRDLLDQVVAHGEADYLRAQGEALAWIVWHKKFCRALLPRDETPVSGAV